MLEVIKYIGKDKDEPDWDEAPIDTLAEANRIAEAESKKTPKALFSVNEDGRLLIYWWQGTKRTEWEIEIRRERHQWN